MSASDVANGIREYTQSDSGYYLDAIQDAQYVIYDITSFILGVLTFFIVWFMFLITALDICYITIPIFQEKVRQERWDGSPGGSKFRIVSNAARIAVDTGNSQGVSPLKIYLKKRIAMYCICGIMLYISFVGFNVIVNLVTHIVLQILNALSQMSVTN